MIMAMVKILMLSDNSPWVHPSELRLPNRAILSVCEHSYRSYYKALRVTSPLINWVIGFFFFREMVGSWSNA